LRHKDKIINRGYPMAEKATIKGQAGLKSDVINSHLCTDCGACVNLCPYQASYKDRVAVLFDCDIAEGRCYAFCPRTKVDLASLRTDLYDETDLTTEAGAIRAFFITRATDGKVRERAQHGGTVSTLMSLALKEGLIEAAVMNRANGNGLPGLVTTLDSHQAMSLGKSSFYTSPTVSQFNRIAATDVKSIGVVALPCQALALAKMKQKPVSNKDNSIDKLRLVIGLFCGWAFSFDELDRLLSSRVNGGRIAGMDIPPSKFHTLEVYTAGGEKIEFSLDEVNRCVRGNCHYCFDMTAEFSDISVGSARLPEGWETAKKWNQVIVRTVAGEKLMELARQKGVLEFRDIPEGNLERLKAASMGKKKTAVKNLRLLSGEKDNLLYLSGNDPLFSLL